MLQHVKIHERKRADGRSSGGARREVVRSVPPGSSALIFALGITAFADWVEIASR